MNKNPDLTKSRLFLDDTWSEDQQMLTRRRHKVDKRWPNFTHPSLWQSGFLIIRRYLCSAPA